ncbi:MAG: flagella basal body P-ring formation protein FlgA [Sphingomonadales bacterium]|nr:flagella basal body P-ring formation protein FlgA [Sphingomonadales bacterium]
MRRLPLLLACAVVPAIATPAAAAGFADPVAIDRAIAAFTGAPQGANGGALLPVDPRLRLAACEQPLALSWRGLRRDTLRVQCPDAGGWHLFIAVRDAPGGGGVPVVARGEEMTLTVTGDGFAVSQSVEALEGGAVGDWIRVAPLHDGKAGAQPIRARILRPGLASVELP